MNVALFLNGNNIIEPFYIEGFSFISDLSSFHTKSKIYLKNTDLNFDKIYIGTEISILFFDDKENLYFNNSMRVSSIKRILGPNSSNQDTLEIVLIHSTYFNDTPSTRAYGVSSNSNKGFSIKSIMSEISQRNSNLFEEFNSIEIQDTEDYPAIRYQINEKNADFLSRMSKYAFFQNLPVYIFSDPKNVLHLSCIANSIKSEPKYCLFPEISSEEILSKSSLRNLKKIPFKNYKINMDSSRSHLSIVNKFSASNFVMTDSSIELLNNMKKPLRIAGNQPSNTHIKYVMPEKTIIRGWNLTPSDARALAIREAFEDNCSLYSLNLIIPGIKLELTTPNTLVRVVFPEKSYLDPITGKYINLGDGDYLVYHSLIGFKNNMWFTQLSLCGINLKVED